MSRKNHRHKHRFPLWLRWLLGVMLGVSITIFAFSFYGYLQERFGNTTGMIIGGIAILVVGALLGWGVMQKKISSKVWNFG